MAAMRLARDWLARSLTADLRSRVAVAACRERQCLSGSASTQAAMSEVVVDIPQGKLRGKREKSGFGREFYCFHQIPYAKPPVGELRFKAPQPAGGWSGVRDATKEGAVCPSADMSMVSLEEGSGEDSLFVNVYCREKPGSGRKWPVMVSFHGGGFEVGSGNRSMSGPDYLVEQDVVVVTFNYRLGVLGFLSLETVECPGNFGLKDQQLALKWVKANIAHFGGDPDNITIFGVSAGAASVHYQTLALSNKGLFHKAIIMSGSGLNRWAHARHPRKAALALAKRLGCDAKNDTELLAFFRKASVEDLVLKGTGVINETEGEALGEWFLNFTFVPAVEPQHEGAFMTKHPWVLMKEGMYLDVPLITGITTEEMILGVKGVEDYPRFKTVEEFQELIPRDIQVKKNSEKALAVAKLLKEFYCKDGIDLYKYLQILSDNFFNYGVFKFVKARATNKNVKSPTYLYLFDYEGNQVFLKDYFNLKAIKGTAHGQDSIYLYKMDFPGNKDLEPDSPDWKFIQKFTKLWTSFAATGVPSLAEPGFAWKETSYPGLEYLYLGESLLQKKALLADRMDFWDRLYTSYYDE